jgi:hypothetical protein
MTKKSYGTHMRAPTKRRYPVGETLHFSGMDWEVTGHEGLFYTKLLRSDGEQRTVSTMSIFHGLQETYRNG